MSAELPPRDSADPPPGRGRALTCLLIAHFASYPMMFAAAVAGMSVSIVAQKTALMAVADQMEATTATQRWLSERIGLGVGDAAAFELIMTPMLVALLVIFVVSHAAALPWARAARDGPPEAEAKARRGYLVAAVGTTLLVVVAGLVGWVLIFAA
jgi:cytochrome b561